MLFFLLTAGAAFLVPSRFGGYNNDWMEVRLFITKQ